MKGKTNSSKFNLYLFTCILGMEFLLVITHGKGRFDHAFFDPLGCLMIGLIAGTFIFFLVKIGISDLIRTVKLVKGNIAENRKIEQKMESAKMLREL